MKNKTTSELIADLFVEQYFCALKQMNTRRGAKTQRAKIVSMLDELGKRGVLTNEDIERIKELGEL